MAYRPIQISLVELKLKGDRLVNRVVAGLPPSRLGLHMCRGKRTRNEEPALQATTAR
jgi:hypothetical protein